jgi:serine/threonine protein kinase
VTHPLPPQSQFLPPLETASGVMHIFAPNPATHELTRPVDVPVIHEHGLSGRLLIGTDIRLDVRVGRGASALVYRATRGCGGPPVAVKVLHAHSADSVHQGLHREVEILRQIDSPWVVKVANEGMLPDGRPWYAMEYIDGRSLATLMGTTSVRDPARVVGWLRGACRGLAAIHAAGWVHRDVKPANLVVVDIGGHEEVKIVDLGIAERIHAKPDMLSGTPEYIAPEQAELCLVDVRSDVYSLGCCAYELLTGHRIVGGRTAFAKINAHILGVHARWPRGQDIPPVLRRLVERCLARRPHARPPTMEALGVELEHVAQLLVGMDAYKAQPLLSIAAGVTEIGIAWPNAAVYRATSLLSARRGGRTWAYVPSTGPTAVSL